MNPYYYDPSAYGVTYLGAEAPKKKDEKKKSFWDDASDALATITLSKPINQFIADNHLEPYVMIAANAISAYYGGAAGVAASNVVTPLMMKWGVDDKKVQNATAAAQAHPEMAQATEVAKDATKAAATAYTVAEITKRAKAGNAQAQKQLDDLNAAAKAGDKGAAQALQLAAAISREQGKSGGPSAAKKVSGWVQIGADQRSGLLAEVAPVVAPGTGAITAKFELDRDQRLHVAICVDGKCYDQSMDLSPAIAAIMARIAQYHAQLHAAMPGHAPPSTVVVGTIVGAIDAAAASAGDAMIGALIGHHVQLVCGGWFDDIGHALGATLRDNKGAISAVATQVATYYGGSTAGAAAGQLAPLLTEYQADKLDPKKDPQKAAATEQAVQQVKQDAKTNFVAAQALTAAQKAVTQTAVAYHVQDTAKKAAAGDPAAQQDLHVVVQEAEKGDPAAKSTAEVIASSFAQVLIERAQRSEWGAKLWEKTTGRGPGTVSGWPYCY